MRNYKDGDELMLFCPLAGTGAITSIAHATNHGFSLTGNTVSVASKDIGAYDATSVGSISWEITSENLHTEDYDALFDLMIEKKPIPVVWATPKDYSAEGLTGDAWTPDSKKAWKWGLASITSLTENANHGEKATYSLTLSGAGAIHKGTINSDGKALVATGTGAEATVTTQA